MFEKIIFFFFGFDRSLFLRCFKTKLRGFEFVPLLLINISFCLKIYFYYRALSLDNAFNLMLIFDIF